LLLLETLYIRSMIDDCLAAVQLLVNWLAQFINFFTFSYASYVYWVNRITAILGIIDPAQ